MVLLFPARRWALCPSGAVKQVSRCFAGLSSPGISCSAWQWCCPETMIDEVLGYVCLINFSSFFLRVTRLADNSDVLWDGKAASFLFIYSLVESLMLAEEESGAENELSEAQSEIAPQECCKNKMFCWFSSFLTDLLTAHRAMQCESPS